MLELRLIRPTRMSCTLVITRCGLRSGCFIGATLLVQVRTLLKY
jgi:hypothetical protein